MFRAFALLASAVPLVAGCAAHRTAPAAPPRPQEPKPIVTGWRAIAKPAEQARIDALAGTWQAARASVSGRSAKRLAAEGALLDPSRALAGPLPPPGSYRCRLLRFGGAVGYRTFAPDLCYIVVNAANRLFVKQTGENLPAGWLIPDGDRRLVFLGTFRAPATSVVAPYGGGAARDVGGIMERVGPARWRLALTEAGGGARLDLYELVPATPAARAARQPMTKAR